MLGFTVQTAVKQIFLCCSELKYPLHVLYTGGCCFEHLPSSVGLFSLCSRQLVAFSPLFISSCCCVRSLFPPGSVAVICPKVPAASDSQNVIKFQKNSRNASCPLPIFQGPVYARMLFLQVSTFNPPPRSVDAPLSSFSLPLPPTSSQQIHMDKEAAAGFGFQQTRNKTEEN